MKSWTQPTHEMIENALSSVKKETDRQYFFSRLKNPLWIAPLRERGYFNSPPGVKQLGDEYVQYPHWPELAYLVSVASEATDQVIDIVVNLPKTDNPQVYNYILEIALNLKDRRYAKQLLPKLVEYTELDTQFMAHRYQELVCHWTTQGSIDEALEIVKRLIPFQKDPRSSAKQQLRKEKPNSYGLSLEPIPRFDQFDYQEILEKGVRPLAEKEPYQVALILIKETANMIWMRFHPEDIDKVQDEDFSETWCKRLDVANRSYQDAKQALVYTLTYACQQVYDRSPDSIEALDRELRKQRWKVFRRLRQLLFTTHPTDQTLPWIRELILNHPDYSKWEHRYGFQLMIRKACEHFGPGLLNESQRLAIVTAILSGPSKEDYCEWMGERYCDEAFQKYQRHFHHKQLRPFSPLLSGEHRHYYQELEEEVKTEAVTDESYSPQSSGTSGWVSYRSPKSVEDLEALRDEELLTYLNDWDNEHEDKDNSLVKINISALAGAFRSLFKEMIVPYSERRVYWLENRDRIGRPIYVAAMVKAMEEIVKEKNFENLEQWIEFCSWVLSHQDSERVDGQPNPIDESRDHPDWRSSRRAVVDFIDTCVDKDTDAPMSAARDGLAHLLQQVCNQFDWRLDRDHPVLLNRADPITEAINNTRSRALQSLINFGLWIHRNSLKDPVPEVKGILSKRIASHSDFPLTWPEHALLGMHFGRLCSLIQEWSIEQREILFPQGDQPVWRDAFGSYIRYNWPDKGTFEILQQDFEYALENLTVLTETDIGGKELVDSLGQHLFTGYLWQVYPLTGDTSLLARFYDKTNDDREHWGRLFNHVGHSLRKSGKHLDKGLTDRIVAFFDWRFEAAEPLELKEFTFWLEAECLDPEWRLNSYSKILDLEHMEDINFFMGVKSLNKLLSDHIPLAVECFKKITDALDQRIHSYISAKEAKPILRAGLNAEDSKVRENAESARENLLRRGRFEFLDME